MLSSKVFGGKWSRRAKLNHLPPREYWVFPWCSGLLLQKHHSDIFTRLLLVSWEEKVRGEGGGVKRNSFRVQQKKNAVTVADKLQRCCVLKWLPILHTDTKLSWEEDGSHPQLCASNAPHPQVGLTARACGANRRKGRNLCLQQHKSHRRGIMQ